MPSPRGQADGVLAKLRDRLPEMGEHLAIDGSDLPAYANGHRHVGNKNGPLREHYSDPDASWGHRSAISTPQARRVIRLQGSRGRLHPHRPADRLAGRLGVRERA